MKLSSKVMRELQGYTQNFTKTECNRLNSIINGLQFNDYAKQLEYIFKNLTERGL